jgi:DNA polymerase-1
MRVLLLDADIVAYVASSVSQTDIDWGGAQTHDVDADKALFEVDRLITETTVDLEADAVMVCLTDPDSNFRNLVYPPYKQNRKDLERPELLGMVKAHLAHEYQSFIRPSLEADDIMGILATYPRLLHKQLGKVDECIMVSIDKDMRTIPAKFYNPDHPDRGVLDISEEDANRFLMWQTIVGDRVDGYPGCPGVAEGGKYTATGFEEGARSFGLAHEVFECDYEDLWDYVVWVYCRGGLTEEDALVQARCAHILRRYSYDFEKREPILWTPDHLELGIYS